MNAYPAVRYHKATGEQRRTSTVEDDAALGEGWYPLPTCEDGTELNPVETVVDPPDAATVDPDDLPEGESADPPIPADPLAPVEDDETTTDDDGVATAVTAKPGRSRSRKK